MGAGRPPGGCKVMKAVSRPPGVKTHGHELTFVKTLHVSNHMESLKTVFLAHQGLMGYGEGRSLLYLWGVRWTGLGWEVVVG